ncbi:MAG TPA: ribose-phosphate diphosphokinase, partial [Candidatus Dormibacteraeota bacterium]|nr:ribose-phosphate diphosphokinase [Candidatus Dormibacteraeota bacterium]
MTSINGELRLLSGTANPELSEKIAREIGVPLGDMQIKRFADGEIDAKIGDSVRGHDVFVIQPTCHPVNENAMELFIILDGLRRASAVRINAVVPYYGYARKEKKTQARDPITAKLMANIIQSTGAHRVVCVDLHADA